MHFSNDTELYHLIGTNIKYYREQAKLTQMQLAELAKISISYLSKIEATGCNKSLSISVLNQIANVLGVEISELYFSATNFSIAPSISFAVVNGDVACKKHTLSNSTLCANSINALSEVALSHAVSAERGMTRSLLNPNPVTQSAISSLSVET